MTHLGNRGLWATPGVVYNKRYSGNLWGFSGAFIFGVECFARGGGRRSWSPSQVELSIAHHIHGLPEMARLSFGLSYCRHVLDGGFQNFSEKHN